MKKIFSECNWAVYFTIPAETQEDGQEGIAVCAWFSYPFQAEEFIEKVLPAENKARFRIAHRSELYAKGDKENV